MIKKIEEIESALAKVEDTVKTLRSERDSARRAAETLRKQLDERELELLQLDEEIQNQTKRYEEEIATLRGDRQTLETKLEAFAGRIRDLIPMLPESEEKRNGSSSHARDKAS